MKDFNQKANRYESERQPVEESVNNAAPAEELQCEETTKKGMMEVLANNKGMAAGVVVAAAAVTGIVIYRKKIWGWCKKPFCKKAVTEEPADTKSEEGEK